MPEFQENDAAPVQVENSNLNALSVVGNESLAAFTANENRPSTELQNMGFPNLQFTDSAPCFF